jgi:hypothetical protein
LDGRAVTGAGVPPGLSLHLGGSVDDLDFDNRHFELVRAR